MSEIENIEDAYPFLWRAFSDVEYRKSKTVKSRLPMSGRNTLIDDVETSTDFTQRRLFGNGFLMRDRWDGENLTCERIEHVAWFSEDLPAKRKLTYKLLEEVCKEREIRLVPHDQYVREYLFLCGYPDTPFSELERGTVAGFNISFDMFRHGNRVVQPRGDFFREGNGCTFVDETWAPGYREARMGIGMRREFTRGKRQSKTWYPPVVVDLAQMVRAMTGRPHNLLSAGKVFGCSVLKFDGTEVHDPEINYNGKDKHAQIRHYVDYALNDVLATAELYEKVMTRFYRHPVRLRPENYVSAASLNKAYMREMGVHAAFCSGPECRGQCTCIQDADCAPCSACRKAGKCVCERCKDLCLCPVCKYGKIPCGAWEVDKETLGLFMAAFSGGRAECGSRLMTEPGVLYDWKSMYPTVMALGGDWDFRIAERIVVRDVTSDMQGFLERVTSADLLRPETWREMRGVAEHRGDCLIPVRIQIPDGASQIATKYVPPLNESDPPLVSAIRDLVASKIRTGKVPKILRALKPFPEGRQSLKPVKFAGRIMFDPSHDNWHRFLVNQRQQLKNAGDPFDEEGAYKETVNADYGTMAEMNRARRKATVYGLNSESWEVAECETPGEFTNPLLAADITAGARLMLAMFQAEVNAAGGHHIFMDTDSIAVHATSDGREGLSWDVVRGIAERFDSLNPWDTGLIPHLVDWQYPPVEPDGSRREVRITSIAAKRYDIWRSSGSRVELLLSSDGDSDSEDFAAETEVVKRSEHGLGAYVIPYCRAIIDDDSDNMKEMRKNFIDDIWRYGLRKYVLGEAVSDPDWFDLPACGKLPIRSRHSFFAFARINEGLDYLDQVIPQSFFLTAYRARGSQALRPDETLQLVAPFCLDSAQWTGLDWMDARSGRRFTITTDAEQEMPGGKVILVKSWREVIREYFQHAEQKYAGIDGKPCTEETRGVLLPGVAFPEYHLHISKDASSIRTADDAFSYKGPALFNDGRESALLALACEVLRAGEVKGSDIEFSAGVPARTARYILSGVAVNTRKSNRDKIIGLAARLARADLANHGYAAHSKLPSYLKLFRLWLIYYKEGAITPGAVLPAYQPREPVLTLVGDTLYWDCDPSEIGAV